MRKLLLPFLILCLLISCNGEKKIATIERPQIKPDSTSIGRVLFKKGRLLAGDSSKIDSTLFYLRLAERFFKEDADKAQVNHYIGTVYVRRNESDKAIDYFLKASRTAQEWQYGYICQEVANLYTRIGRYREGIAGLDSIRKIMDCLL